MFTYICLGTNDIDRAVRFYDAALGALGIHRCITGDPEMDRTFAGWGTYENDGATEIALWVCSPFNKRAATAGNGTMVADARWFRMPTSTTVPTADEFTGTKAIATE